LKSILKQKRLDHNLTLKDLSQLTLIDQAILSKYENGKRIPSAKQIKTLSEALNTEYRVLSREILATKIIELIKYETDPLEIIQLAESRVEYLKKSERENTVDFSDEVRNKLNFIDKLKDQWKINKPLNKTQLEKLQEYFSIKYTYESNKIEGNTLTYQETNLVVSEGITISGKSMKDHLEAINHTDAIAFITDLINGNEDINKRNLLDIHRLVLKSIDQENAGKYRSVPVMISGSAHVPPQPYLIEKLMEDYYDYYNHHKKHLHPVILATEMHERLVSIHPFIDGNGRTARLVMNFILLKNNYTVTILKGDQEARLAYYKALEDVQLNNKRDKFYHLILDQLKNSLTEHLNLT